MFESLRLKNFKGHKDFACKFTEGINIILGTGDRGKTNLVRAMAWLACKRKYSNVINHDANSCEVQAVVDGRNLSRYHSSKMNRMTVDGDVYEKIGKDGCEASDKILNMSDINFQFQYDPSFFLSLTPGQAAAKLNEVANLSEIGVLLDAMKKDMSKASESIDATTKDIEEERLRFKAFSGVKEAKANIDKANSLDADIVALFANIKVLGECLVEIRRVKVPGKVTFNVYKMEMEIGKIGIQKKELDSITNLLIEYDALHVFDIPNKEVFDMRQEWCYSVDKIKEIQECLVEYESLDGLDDELSEAKEAFNEVAPDFCPTCKQAIIRER